MTVKAPAVIHAADLILIGVDSNIYNVKDLRNHKISHLTLTLGRLRGGVDTTPPGVFPMSFFDDSNRKNRLIVSDWRHILTYVTSFWRCYVTYVITSYVNDGQNTLLLQVFVNRDNIWWRRDKVKRLVFSQYIIEVAESKNVKISHVTLTNDPEIWGQTSFNSSIYNRTCNYDAKLILVSIFTFLRSGILKKLK